MSKTILSIQRHEEGIGVEFHTNDADDVIGVAAGITSIFTETPMIRALVEKMLSMLDEDEEFRHMVEQSTIRLPDFNKILKS